MIKVSDYIVKRLVEHDVTHVFMISGGGAMHLNDSVGKNKALEYVCNHHEQASAMAAEGYSRVSGKLGVVVVTTGPGGINTLNGVLGQWTDSVPVLYISGQVKRETSIYSSPDTALRQLGDQEADIVSIVKPITKFAATLNSPENVKKLVDKAIYIATHGRPGPVWIDVPLDIQSSLVDEASLQEYDPDEDKIYFSKNDLSLKIAKVIELLKESKRPVIIAGHGIRIAKAQEVFANLITKLKIPVVSTFNGMDLIPSDHEFYIGRIGTIGDRAGNFALQNADIVLSIGSRNNIRQISYNWQTFAKSAKKIIVDIDEAELEKPTVKPDLAVLADAKEFLDKLSSELQNEIIPDCKNWTEWCLERKKRYPVVLPEYKKIESMVNPYYFMQILTKNMKTSDVAVAGNGTACVSLFQAAVIKENQRIFWNSGCASMGYDLPAAIGACFANDKKEVICITGDGSLQMNLQELQTVAHHNLPIKLFVLNNNGYCSIKQTQDAYFESNYVACNSESGVSCPDMSKIASAYGFAFEKIESQDEMEEKIKNILKLKVPVICEVMLTSDYTFSPKLSSERLPDGKMVSKPLEDMYPFLSREEFKSNMIID